MKFLFLINLMILLIISKSKIYKTSDQRLAELETLIHLQKITQASLLFNNYNKKI